MNRVLENYFSAEDAAFVLQIDKRYPQKNIARNFETFLNLKPEDRLKLALEMRKKVLRSGWGQKGVPWEDVETIDEHTLDMQDMAREGISGHPQLPRVLDIIDSHDTPEVIIGDFTPDDGLSKADKFRLEHMAAKVIFEAHPEMLECWEQFERCDDFPGMFAKDMDVAQMFKRAKKYMTTHPKANMSQHDRYCRDFAYKTPEGQAVFQKLALN